MFSPMAGKSVWEALGLKSSRSASSKTGAAAMAQELEKLPMPAMTVGSETIRLATLTASFGSPLSSMISMT